MACALDIYMPPHWWDDETITPEHLACLEFAGGLPLFQYRNFVSDRICISPSVRFRSPPFVIPSEETAINASAGILNQRRVQEMNRLRPPLWSSGTMKELLIRRFRAKIGAFYPIWKGQFKSDWYKDLIHYKVNRPVPYATFRTYWEKLEVKMLTHMLSFDVALDELRFHPNCVLYPEHYEYIEDNHPVFG